MLPQPAEGKNREPAPLPGPPPRAHRRNPDPGDAAPAQLHRRDLAHPLRRDRTFRRQPQALVTSRGLEQQHARLVEDFHARPDVAVVLGGELEGGEWRGARLVAPHHLPPPPLPFLFPFPARAPGGVPPPLFLIC